MKHVFVINPAAGSRDQTAAYTRAIRSACGGRGLDYRIERSTAPGDCRNLARQAAESGEDVCIYACGGDGTLNEVAAGAAGFPNAAVTHYAGGSGNDFVKIFDDPAAFRDLERLLDSREATFDLVRCNDDLCLNICSVGLDARIGTDVATYKRWPLLNGFRAYALSAVVNTIRGVSEHYVVQIAGETIDARQTMICVCNGRFYGGGFNPVPEADPADGMLEVLLVRDVSRLKVLQVVGKYKNGRYADYPELIRHVRTDHLTIHCDAPTPVNLDGELRIAQDVEIALAEQKLRFRYPRGLSWSSAACAVAR